MPSVAKVLYDAQRQRADLIVRHAASLRRASQRDDKLVLLHAALAAHVAAWDAYIKAIAKEKYSFVARPADVGYSTLRQIAEDRMTTAARKLNTPNAENARNFLMEYSSFDPWPSWVNARFGAINLPSVLGVRERLNEIFQVRHSFAHGLTMPVYIWNQDNGGVARLDVRTLRAISGFFDSLVSKTDVGYALHIATTFAVPRPW